MTSGESTYACCSSFTVVPVTMTFHFDRSRAGEEKSSKKIVRLSRGTGTEPRRGAPASVAASTAASGTASATHDRVIVPVHVEHIRVAQAEQHAMAPATLLLRTRRANTTRHIH